MKKKLELKGNSAVTCYIQLLQNNISRMSTQSGIIKASMCVIYTIVATFINSIETMNCYLWITLPVTLFIAIIDSYYLAMEHIYINKYNEFINDINSNNLDIEKIYNMNPRSSSCRYELLIKTLYSLKSFSILGFYGLFVVLTIILYFI
ncbi:MAG: hypothetical protein K6G37_01895 [Bacilli bacterium]|nr:hypothetical protein [Bacilli bacterium]